jgi:hypothetical protein
MVARYRLVEKCFLQANGTQEAWLHLAGEVIEYDGIPHRHMIPLNAEAREAIAAIPPITGFAKNFAVRRGDPPPSSE